MSFTLATWNVLHRVHAQNWGEAAVRGFPDERARVEGVTQKVLGQLATGCSVVCLQEVSGDQLASLRGSLPPGAAVHAHCYPRVPRPRTPPPRRATLADVSEQLVTIVHDSRARVLHAQTFPSDPGKGLLAVALDGGAVVINTHLTFGTNVAAQLTTLATVAAGARPGLAVLAGDFNTRLPQVLAALDTEVGFADLSGQTLRTRPHPAGPGKNIDHVLAFGGEVLAATVVSAEGLSDHNLVVATVRARGVSAATMRE
jgi:endonuclease/exonuclease/phosphatase family metal-dependent hydrolase